MAQPVVTLTVNPAVDISSSVEHVAPERKLRCRAPRKEPGGGGLNVSRALHELGGQSLALYLAGGPNGCLLAELLNRAGVENRAIPIEGATREDFTIVGESSGSQFRFIMPGPEVTNTEWQRCLTELEAVDPQPQYVVASGSLPPGVPADFYARVARIAKQGDSRLILDTSG